MNVNVRRAAAEDASAIARLFDLYRIFYQQEPDIKGAENFITERLLNNDSVIFLALDAGKAVGFTQLYPIFTSVGMQRTWLLNDLYVDDTVRGKGIGAALLEAAKTFAKETGSKWLMLQTGAENTAAQSLYEKNGWVKENDFFYMYSLKE